MTNLFYRDPMRFFWMLTDSAELAVSNRLVQQWSPDVRSTVERFGLLREAENAELIMCPECHDHFEEVIFSEIPNGSSRLFIQCPELYRVEVDPEDLKQWAVNCDALIGLL